MRRAGVLAVVLLASFAYFYEGGGWNQNTRFNLVRALVEEHTLKIDAYHENTGDKARVGDHYYTDKAPGASLTAVPFVAVTYVLQRLAGGDAQSPRAVGARSYVATVAAAAVPTVFAALCVFFIARSTGASEAAATFAAVVCGLGTPLWAYATILYGHALAGGCLMLAFLGAVRLGESTPARNGKLSFLTGLAAGWAVITEFPASIPAGVLVLFAFWQVWRVDRTRARRVAIALGAGLACGAAVLIAYNALAFGKPFHVGYTSEEGSFEAMRTGIFGVNLPQLPVIKELLFGDLRGLIPLAPVLAAAPVGLWWLVRDPRTRAIGLVATAVALYFLLMTSGYAYWNGGWSYASRHMGPGLPFLCLGLATFWQRAKPARAVHVLILMLAAVGVGETLVAVATTPQPPIQYQHPMRELLWPAFKSGDFPIGWQSVLEKDAPRVPLSELEENGVPRASWNLGQLVGLTGHASLVPLYLIWLMGAIAIHLSATRPSARSDRRYT